MGVYGVTKSQTPATEYAHTFSFLLKIKRIVQFSVSEMTHQFSLHCPVLLSSICLCTVFFFFNSEALDENRITIKSLSGL